MVPFHRNLKVEFGRLDLMAYRTSKSNHRNKWTCWISMVSAMQDINIEIITSNSTLWTGHLVEKINDELSSMTLGRN